MIGMEHHGNGAIDLPDPGLPARPRRGLARARRRHRGLHLRPLLRGPEPAAFDVGREEDPKIRSINMVQIGRALTDKTLDPPLRALVVYNSNPATIAPNQNLVLEGLRREELLTVVVEQRLTDTARYADFVFPATTELEHLDLFTSWGQEYLSLNLPALPPRGEARTEHRVLPRARPPHGLHRALPLRVRRGDGEGAARQPPPLPGRRDLRAAPRARLRAPRLARAWLPFANGHFSTPSGKCELYSEAPGGPGPGPAARIRAVARGPAPRQPPLSLALLTSKSTRHFNNSSHAASRASARPRASRGCRCTPRMPRRANPGRRHRAGLQSARLDDAARQVQDGTRPGVVSLPQGFWAEPPPGRLVRERPHPRRPERPGAGATSTTRASRSAVGWLRPAAPTDAAERGSASRSCSSRRS